MNQAILQQSQHLHLCCCTDDNYAQHCAVMLCSLFENNRAHTFTVHILINTLKDEYKKSLKKLAESYNSEVLFYEVDSTLLEGCKYRSLRPLSEAAYYRVLLSSIIPTNIDKILYLDCDIVVIGDVGELFEIELDGYPLAAVQEPVEICEDHRRQLSIPYGESYFNSGVLLINLDYWRKNDSQTSLLEFSKRDRFVYCHDQDALNYVFKKQWYRLPPKWNKSNTATLELIDFYHILDKREYIKDARIIHYIDEPKPWYGIYGTRYRKLYKKYLKISGWKSINIKVKNPLNLYKRVFISRLKGFLYNLGLLTILKNIKVLWLSK